MTTFHLPTTILIFEEGAISKMMLLSKMFAVEQQLLLLFQAGDAVVYTSFLAIVLFLNN